MLCLTKNRARGDIISSVVLPVTLINSNTYVTMIEMDKIKIVEYLEDGVSVFGKWFSGLDGQSAAKVATALYRLEQGNFSNVKSVGQGVSEYRIDFGPGYRIYFGCEGDTLVVLLGGGSKKTQSRDIRNAQTLWAHYKKKKRK